MRHAFGLGFVLSIGLLGACVGSDPVVASSASADGGSNNDGGGDADSSAGAFALQTSAAGVTVFEGATTTVNVDLTRRQFNGAVSVTASGFGSGVTIAPLEIGAGGTEGTLTIAAAVGATHGTSVIALKGVGDGVADQTATLNLLVRGAAGTFDNSFGTGGKTTGSGAVTGLALQADGKIVVVGNAGTETFVARHAADGTPDLTFGGTGRVDLPDLAAAADVAVRADGKIFIAGTHASGNTAEFGVTRVSANGAIEPAFGANGTRAFGWPEAFSSNATGIGVDVAGNIVVGGYRFDGTSDDYDFAILRLTGDDGHLDPAFSGDGFDNVDFGGLDMAYGLAIKPDGSVVLAGGGNAPNEFALARYLPDGTLDPGLNGTGQTTLAFPATMLSTAQAVAVQPDNKMVAAGYLTPNSGSDDPVLVRFAAGGLPDPNFGTGGSAITAVSAGPDRFASVALQSDGAIVVAGFTQPGDATTSQFLVVRYTAAGILDSSFANTGIVKTAFAGEGDAATRVVIQPDGRILVAGKVGASNYGLARYWY